MRVGPAANVARINVAESITALWTFAHADGISLDDIIERTAAAGVTIDGLLVKDAGIPQAAVTAHEAALAILLGQITDGVDLTERNVAESIVALWEFAHASGLKSDVISERTGAAGVTIDGMLVKDKAILSQALGSAATPFVRIKVTGDTQNRFLLNADGAMFWGSGAVADDVKLYRSAANVLKTDDSFHVAGVLAPLGDLELPVRNITFGAGAQDDIVTGAVTVQRITSDAGGNDVNGFAGGRAGRLLIVINIGPAGSFTIQNQDAGSVAANRIITPVAGPVIIGVGDGATLWYDGTTARWRMIHYVV